jgi:hypothetical protein
MKTKKRVVIYILRSVKCVLIKIKKYFIISLVEERIFKEYNLEEGILSIISGNKSK